MRGNQPLRAKKKGAPDNPGAPGKAERFSLPEYAAGRGNASGQQELVVGLVAAADLAE